MSPTHYIHTDTDTTGMSREEILELGLFDYELENLFNDFVDESNDPVVVSGMTLVPSECLKEADPTAYRAAFNDWLSHEGWNESGISA